MNVAIIIPNYNGAALLKKNLPEVFDAAVFFKEKYHVEVEIIIVDDSSTDESIATVEFFKSSHAKSNIPIKLVTSKKNKGFSTTVNNGVKNSDADIVVLLNTDVKPDKDFLSPLLHHFQNSEVFAVGCMDRSVENGKIVLRGRGIGRWRRGFLAHQAGSLDKTDSFWASGGSSAYRKSVWDKLDGMNELFNPFYWEDIDLCYRARKMGYTILFEKASIVTHEHEKGAILSKYSKSKIKEIAYRNQIIFSWCNITDRDLLLSHLLWLPYHLVSSALSGSTLFLKGFLQSMLLLPSILSQRRKMSKRFVKSDHSLEILS